MTNWPYTSLQSVLLCVNSLIALPWACLGDLMFSTCIHHYLIWTLELFCRMPWSSSFIFLTKLNVLMLWNLNWIPQGVSSLVLKSASYVHLGRLLIIKGLTTFFLWIFHCMKLLINKSKNLLTKSKLKRLSGEATKC